LRKQVLFSTLKTWIGFKRAHVECMKGTPEDSLAYCTKQDSDAFIRGELPAPGKRTDVHKAVELIREGRSLRELANGEDIAGAVAVVKFSKGLTILRSLCNGPRTKPPQVFWLHGATGTGKTKCAIDFGLKIGGGLDAVWISGGGFRWFDGYDGQPVAIFDDFRAKDVKFNYFLRLLDRYPMDVEFKGGFVAWKPEFIVVTAPVDPEECFATRKEHRPEDIRQLLRRITQVFHLTELRTVAGDVISDWLGGAGVEGCSGSVQCSSGSDVEPDVLGHGGDLRVHSAQVAQEHGTWVDSCESGEASLGSI
jgi:hypothetical protein